LAICFFARNPEIWAIWGHIVEATFGALLCPAKFDLNQRGEKLKKVILTPGSFLPVIIAH